MTLIQDQKSTCTLPQPPAAVHFVGIGGIGMSGLARILHAWGYRVTGSDAVASEQTASLQREGIPVLIGHGNGETAAAADLVVLTAAVREQNPEVKAAHDAGVPTVKRAQLLGMLANARRCVAVAGSHGKSTTSAMLATALLALGEQPAYAVGAVLSATGANAAPGAGDMMVVEADEYDYSFLWLRPEVAVVTNVELDHPDIFPDQEAYDDAFLRFLAGVQNGGTLVIAADDPGCARLLARSDLPPVSTIVTFGETVDAGWRLTGGDGEWSVQAPDGTVLALAHPGPGRHNARNASAAVAALAALGVSPDRAAESLSAFTGIGRRFELNGEAGGVTVIDDYAHHPSEIRATLDAARTRFPGRRLWVVFQPHTFSRTKALLDDFAFALAEADEIVLLDIYPSRETDTLGISSADLLRRLPDRAHAGSTPADAVPILAREVQCGDVVLTLGAGDVTSIGPALLSTLAQSGMGA